MRMYLDGNFPVSTSGARRWRLRLPVLGLLRCVLPAWLRLSLPVAVTRKRFFDALWVFILGTVAPTFPMLPETGRPWLWFAVTKRKEPLASAKGPRVSVSRTPTRIRALYRVGR